MRASLTRARASRDGGEDHAVNTTEALLHVKRGLAEHQPQRRPGRYEIRCLRNNGVLRTVSADGFVAHGLNPSAVIVDELHAWRTSKQVELFDALDTAIHKRPDAYWLTITTARPRKGVAARSPLHTHVGAR